MNQDYMKTELDYQSFLIKIHDWYLKGNSGMLYNFLLEMFLNIPPTKIEEYVIRAIADKYITTKVIWTCINCNHIINEVNRQPKFDEEIICKECDSEFIGESIDTSIELVFNKESFHKEKFFRIEKSGRLFGTKDCCAKYFSL